MARAIAEFARSMSYSLVELRRYVFVPPKTFLNFWLNEALHEGHVFLATRGNAHEDQAMEQPGQLRLGAVLARKKCSLLQFCFYVY